MPAALLLSALAMSQPADRPPSFDPTARYVVAGQDESGYRDWYLADPERPIRVAGFHHYLTRWDAAWVLPTWQIVRTASDWHKCDDEPFEVPPTGAWPNIVQTLRFIRDEVIPAVGPVEALSAYRNPTLNICAKGSPTSAHRGFYALDLVPLNETTREELIRAMCTVHYRRGQAYDVGLGFYVFLRFHVDSKGFRTWGPPGEESPCIAIQEELKGSETANSPAN
jgi:hypothetical protein